MPPSISSVPLPSDSVSPRKLSPRWVPSIGAKIPDFQAETTRGTLKLRAWANGSWTFLFGFPSTFASVCSTEVIAFAARRKAFEALGVRVMGITPAGLRDTLDWVLDLEKVFGLDIHFPIVADEQGTVLRQLGLIPTQEVPKLAVRPSFFIDPTGHVRMYTVYPPRMGRCSAEVLRCFEGLIDVDYTGLALPADWRPGEDLVAPRGVGPDDMQRAFGDDWSKISDYLMVAHVKGHSES